MASPESFLLDISKTLIGTFVGAGLAFFVNWTFRQSQKEEEQIKAGYVAMVILGRMITAFISYKEGITKARESVLNDSPDAPFYLQIRYTVFDFDEALALDIPSITFLFDSKNVNLINHLLMAQDAYRNIVHLHKHHTVSMEQFREKIAEFTDAQRKTVNIKNVQEHLPRHLTSQMEELNKSLIAALTNDEVKLIEAVKALKAALNRKFSNRVNIGLSTALGISFTPNNEP
ncbi:hypothetical protein [Undibacterium sp. Ji49W]|uniref:hypothetical protein n=1 Tax=Undibacterium sp. Ji49W TaxID=3413040 RepID=UPI003BF2B3B7